MQLLQHFKELTIRPKNSKELKGLILQLAIQGKLTANWRDENQNIEPISESLKRIQKEKEQLVQEKKIRKEKLLPEITKDEVPYEIPIKWNWCRMLDFCYLITDGAHHTPKYVDSGIPFLSVKNLSKGFMDFSNTKFVEEETHKELIKRCHPEFEDILLTKIGTTGIAKVIDTKDDFSIFVSVALLKIAKKEVFPLFIEHCINSPFIKKQSSEGTEGVGNKNLVLRKIKSFIIPLPPIEEQKEIVNVVETLFKEVEQLERLTVERIGLKEDFVTSALNQFTTNNTNQEWAFLQDHFKNFFNETSNIKKLRETVLQLAVQGKLTVDWRANNPDIEDASQLLKQIQEEKAQLIKEKKIKKEKALPPITKEEIPYELPKSWVWCRLNDICEYIQRGKSPKYTEIPKIPVVSQKCVQWSGFDISRARFITEESLEKYVEARFLQKGDLLWNSTGDGTIGRVISYPETGYKKVVADSHVTVVRAFKKYIDTKYLWIFTASPLIQELVAGRVTGSTKQTELGTGTVKSMEFSFPPLEEQKAIAEKVNALMGLCDSLEQEVQQSHEQSQQLMQAVLQEVFEPKEDVLKELIPDIDKYAQVAMVTQKMENTFDFKHGKVEKQKTSFLLQAVKKQSIPYIFQKQHFGTFSWELSEDLDKNPFLRKVKAGQGEVYEVKANKSAEVLKLLNDPQNFSYIQAIDELIQVYQMPLIDGKTEQIELLNTVCKSMLDTQSIDLNSIYADMEFWTIKQDGFTSKAEKFSLKRTEKMLELVLKLGWDKELIKD